MFTGIIAAIGRITDVSAASDDPDAGVRVVVDPAGLAVDDVAIGDSIAINGACMTVVARDRAGLHFDVSRESLAKTAGFDVARDVNLEKAMRFGDRLDGHLVSGHVDGTGTVVTFEPVGESYRLVVRAPTALSRFLALKGSVAVDGVSLTINAVVDRDDGCDFAINLIPHTVAVTTFRTTTVGSRVNLEIDTIARYVDRMIEADGLATRRGDTATRPRGVGN